MPVHGTIPVNANIPISAHIPIGASAAIREGATTVVTEKRVISSAPTTVTQSLGLSEKQAELRERERFQQAQPVQSMSSSGRGGQTWTA